MTRSNDAEALDRAAGVRNGDARRLRARLNDRPEPRASARRARPRPCAREFVDHALEFLRPGDTLCVWRLDRLGRSLPHLVQLAGELADRDIALRSLTEQIDASSAGGRLVFHVFGALAEFERALIQERTHAGLAAARARGRKGGRKTVMTPKRLAAAKSMLGAKDPDGRHTHTYDDVAQAIGVSRSPIIRHCT